MVFESVGKQCLWFYINNGVYVETILNPTFVLYKFLYTAVRIDPLDCNLFRLPMKLVNMVKK